MGKKGNQRLDIQERIETLLNAANALLDWLVTKSNIDFFFQNRASAMSSDLLRVIEPDVFK
jgi:hypothetical protein